MYHTITGDEGKVNDLVASLLHAVLSNRFIERIQPSVDLNMGNFWTSAKPDVSVVLFPQQIQGIIVVEDKLSGDNSAVARTKAEAQMIAEGIAVSQADNWPQNTPVYMIRCMGSLTSIYKATFSQELLDAVRNGHNSNVMTNVLRYEPRFAPNMPRGINIFDINQRQILVRILCSIEQDILNRFP
jgi:hypothetical protein